MSGEPNATLPPASSSPLFVAPDPDDPDGPDPAVGRVLAGRYRIERCVGEGGMGRVYLAQHLHLEKTVAIKVLTNARAVPRAAERFFREAKATAAIGHPNIIETLDFGETREGVVYIVLEYLDGEDLADTLDRCGRMPWTRAAKIVMQVCRALGAAHAKGIVHRDVKPENIFRIERDGDPDFIKVLDFGIAKLVGPKPADRRLTRTGAVFGTPAYMSPQQARGREIDHRADVYAVGVILFELCTGRVPFDGEEFLDIAMQHLHKPVQGPSHVLPAGSVPPELDAIVERAMAKEADDRFASMLELESALSALVEGRPIVVSIEPRPSQPIVVPTVPTVPTVESGPIGVPQAGPRAVTLESDASMTGASSRGSLAIAFVAVLAAAAVAAFAVYRLTANPDDARTASAGLVDDSTPPRDRATKGDARAIDPDTGSQREPETDSEMAVDTDAGSVVEPVAEPPPPTVPKASGKLSRRQIDRALSRTKSQLASCAGSITGVARGTKFHVEIVVSGATGKVISVRAKADRAAMAAVGCVQDTLRHTRFPTFAGDEQRFSRTVKL